MTIKDIGELLIFGFDGTYLPKEIISYLKNTPTGGIILFKRNILDLKQVINLNQEIFNTSPKRPPLISVDQEGGRVARLRGICTDIPPMQNLSSKFFEMPKLAYRLGALMGRELGSLGFNLNFAPVCDILTNKENNLVGDRSFSDDPKKVALFCEQIILGMQGAGIAACAKHFPGHGDTIIDSHFDLPFLSTNIETLRSREFEPFKSAIASNVASIMTAHIVMKELDPNLPATMSKTILQDILRQELKFNGLIISDDLDMKAVSDNYLLKEIVEKSLLASVDMFIIGNNFSKVEQIKEIIIKLVDKNIDIKNKVAEAIERVKKFKIRYMGKPTSPSLDYANEIIRCKPHLDLVEGLL